MKINWKHAVLCCMIGTSVILGAHTKAMAEQRDQTPTWCIGDYLVDIPVWLTREAGQGSVGTVRVEQLGKGDREALNDLFEQRRRVLVSGAPLEDGSVAELTETSREGEHMSLLWQAVFPALDYKSPHFTEEIFAMSSDDMLKATSFVEAEFIERDRRLALSVARSSVPLGPSEIPKGEGFCMSDTFVAMPVTDGTASMTFVDLETGPFALSVSILTRGSDSRPLSPRAPFDDPAATAVSVAGIQGETLKGMNDNVQEYVLRAQGKALDGDAGVSMSIRMTDQRAAGGHPMMDPDEFDAMWQRLLSSVRPRT